MDSLEKVVYETPAMQVVEVKTEGVICASGDPEEEGHGNGFTGWY